MSQNQGRTPLISPLGSNISGLALKSNYPPTHSPTIIQTTPILIDPLLKYEQLHMRTAIPVGTVLRLQETPNSVRILSIISLISINYYSQESSIN
jgi:hypothetical protein